MRDEADQARYIVERVLENREAGALLKQQAVLFRTSSHSGPLEIELTRRNIPFVKFGGLKFLDAAHVKDMLALLRFVENPRDRVAGFRLLHLLPGVGPASAQRVLDRMAEAADPIAALAQPAAAAARRRRLDRRSSHDRGNLRYSEWPVDLERARLWYEPHLDRIHEDAETRRADLIQLEQIAGGYPSRERFLTELTLDPPDATSDQAGVPLLDEDYLILSTIHSAKGQEWKSVFVLNVVDGCMPSDLGAGTTRRARGGAPPALRRDDPRQGRSAPDRAAALLHPRPARARATATSMPRARASFPKRFCRCLNRTAWPPATAAQARPRTGHRKWISGHGCAACGASLRASFCPERPGAPRHFLAPRNSACLKAGNTPRATASYHCTAWVDPVRLLPASARR